ncbi:hypothetical protein [Streptomyces sasae]|uniref:hypothetical protein n=1 Tax=Streptomyces sasae TaxID=1266772 RepID=UPI00292D0D2E|nr:hypothetical protein [Streptomyces sasae]
MLGDVAERLLPRYAPEQLDLIADYPTRSRDVQQEHTERLRQIRASGTARKGGRRPTGPR